MREADLEPYWNTNVARHPDILRAVPAGCGDALDAGCGDGLLARKLTARAKRVTGIDRSPEAVARARGLAAGRPEPTFLEGGFHTAELPEGAYDFVCSVAAIHYARGQHLGDEERVARGHRVHLRRLPAGGAVRTASRRCPRPCYC